MSDQEKLTTRKSKPQLSFWEIWNMSFGFLGIQFGFALQNANVSRIFETLGAEVEEIPILWIAAPLTGLIVQPIIGYFSDRTWSPKWGRRRPYFMVGAILASVALFIMPNSPVLWIAAGMLWIMDASINVSMEPFRAFVGDNLPSEQRTTGFAMQSFFIGIGAVIASVLPYIFTNWFGISNTAAEGIVPDSVKWSFYVGGIVFLIAVMWTVFKSKEYSPEELMEFGDHDEETYSRDTSEDELSKSGNSKIKIGLITILIGALGIAGVMAAGLQKELYILLGMLVFVGILLAIAGNMQKSGSHENGFVTIMDDFQHMPKTMKQLAWVQFFSWFALFSMWIYTTNGVTRTIYDLGMEKTVITELQTKLGTANITDEGKMEKIEEIREDLAVYLNKSEDPVTADMKVVNYFSDEAFMSNLGLSEGARGSIERIQKEYNTGADWVGVCFGVYNGFAAVFAFLLIWFAKRTNRKTTHALSLVIGGISFLSIFFISNPMLLLVSFIGIGLAWASILAMPYAILTGSLPANKMGYYMGVFNFFIVIPQLVAATILGFLVSQFFGGEPIYALVVGGVSLLLSALLTMRVDDEDEA